MNSLPQSCREVLIKITTTNNRSSEVKNNQEPLRTRQWLEACQCSNAGLCNDCSWPRVWLWGEGSASAGGDVAHMQTVLPGTMMHFRGWTMDAAICPEITAAHLQIMHSVRVTMAMPAFLPHLCILQQQFRTAKKPSRNLSLHSIKYESKSVPVSPSIPTAEQAPLSGVTETRKSSDLLSLNECLLGCVLRFGGNYNNLLPLVWWGWEWIFSVNTQALGF